MKPKKVICPICGEKMIATNWGIERRVHRGFGNDICVGETENYVNYKCSCGCKINYKGSKSCWQKECKCKSCAKKITCFRCGKEISLGEIRYVSKNYTECEKCYNTGMSYNEKNM